MNGRQVFNFAAINVPAQIKAYLQRENILPDEVDLYCLHQGSAAIVNSIARRFPECREKFILDLESTGNTVSSSIPLLLEKHFIHSKYNSAIVSGFGVGLSWATNLIHREPKS
jgi:3-oxoacyl-[acyl-carrier-protein] synthase-3